MSGKILEMLLLEKRILSHISTAGLNARFTESGLLFPLLCLQEKWKVRSEALGENLVGEGGGDGGRRWEQAAFCTSSPVFGDICFSHWSLNCPLGNACKHPRTNVPQHICPKDQLSKANGMRSSTYTVLISSREVKSHRGSTCSGSTLVFGQRAGLCADRPARPSGSFPQRTEKGG